MSFYPRRKRAAPAIVIISLIDVLIVLLVFLLVSTTYRNQPSVKLTLPEVAEAPKAGATDSKPPLIVTIAASEPAFFIGNRAVTEDKLGQELQSAAAGNPDLQVVLSADKAAPWEKVARALQMTRRAGVKNIRAFTKGGAGR
jgi:biopolymer transport protein ExbD